MKGSKELNNIFEAINKWMKKYNNNVLFVASFIAFKGKDCKVVDDRMLAFGEKDSLRLSLKGLDEGVYEDKEDFVNW